MGAVIALNNHRLMNGDATSKDDVSELIGDCTVDLLLTDPPYGINIVNTVGGGSMERLARATSIQVSSSKEREREREQMIKIGKVGAPGVVQPRLYKPVIGDDKPFNPQHLLDLDVPSIIFGANNFAHELPNNHRWLVWFKKSSLEFKRNNFSDVELCWTNLKGKSCLMYWHSWSGMVRAGDRKAELTERVHPTQKPVGLLEQMITEFTEPGDTVLDLYGGSGSTLIACENTGRKCLIMELSKDYCKIIEDRYWDFVGKGQSKLDNWGEVYG